MRILQTGSCVSRRLCFRVLLVRTDFLRVQVLLPSLQILCSDFRYVCVFLLRMFFWESIKHLLVYFYLMSREKRYTTTEGKAYIVGSGGSTRTDYDCSLYGFAQGSCGPSAHARIDLRRTPFGIDTTFAPTGWNPRGAAWHGHRGQVGLHVFPLSLPLPVCHLDMSFFHGNLFCIRPTACAS